MVTQGGVTEIKTIGLSIGTSGTHYNTYFNSTTNSVELQVVGVDGNGNNVLATEGYWISDIVNMVDKFEDYGKVFTVNIDNGGSSVAVQTRTSSNGTTWEEWIPVALDGTIQSTTQQYIQVKVLFFAGYTSETFNVSEFNSATDKNLFTPNEFIDTSSNLKLKRDYSYQMTNDVTWTDDGDLHRQSITRNQWLKIDKLNIV